MLIDPMADIQPLVLAQHAKDVSIFRNTRAIDVPDKLDAVANSIKLYANVEITGPVQRYVNYNLTNVHTYVNDSIAAVVADQSRFTRDMSEDISGYLDDSGAGYNVGQSRSLIETGVTGDVEFDELGRITSSVQGVLTTSNITYDNTDRITRFTETITVDGVANSTVYVVEYDSNQNARTSIEAE